MQGLSLFASAGIAEMNLGKYINFVLANELLPIRSKVHRFWHPKAEMICGDITDDKIKENIIEKSIESNVDFILATPPCQGVSLIGKNKRNAIIESRNCPPIDIEQYLKYIPDTIVSGGA